MNRSRSIRNKPVSGARVLIALLVGFLLGGLVALFLRTVISNTPVDIHSQRLNLFFIMVTLSGALGAVVIESMRQLQQSSTEAEYHRRRRRGLR
ncbi:MULTISPECIES: hypothetical protein [Prochlorococcus]|uniref:hypothetical protein n=1 Tax=Prochlorococcus TaxID=1218 RepID=UPI0007B3A86C|nr:MULTISPECIES: hypothetical protein [Prochlorococcus]KZR68210.1 hypothetical protein PMIT1312_00170 [Prochlorococcus marinus str. MIT 1312]KZR84037.1 hypothetical protein PMIT1327_00202 [Prochlorococcus marinus str. MIT 1327]NMO84195.1 hypothetical protein [Prochlorococcus sp. P1344]NMP05018.1 hypothetical protein [Prochlorococcus sp. P1361]NMP12487.1 hypothetical protein [Prochlorococcus sp.P1363]